MNISLGFSPCPNDTYMFAAMVNGWIDTGDMTFSVHMEDVEQLNAYAGSSILDLTKMSFHRALSLENDYVLLSSGAALGFGCGPLLISKEILTKRQILEGPIALPGEWTTAHLLFKLFYPDTHHKVFVRFDEIEDMVLHGRAAGGVIIHENRFTYQAKGLVCLADLGKKWEEKTGLPIPLGGIFAHRRLSEDLIGRIDSLIRESIQFAHSHPHKVMPYVRQYAQEMDEEVMRSHIGLYVNDYSLSLGKTGMEAVEALKKS